MKTIDVAEKIGAFAGNDPEMIRAGLEAFAKAISDSKRNLISAIANGQIADVQFWAHKLKSSAQFFNREILSRQLAFLEKESPANLHEMTQPILVEVESLEDQIRKAL